MNVAASILSGGEPAAPAVLDRDGICTYDELRQRVNGVATALLARGHAKGDRIGIFAENSAFFVTAYLGIIRAGLVAVPLQTELSAESLAAIALDSGMSAVLVPKSFVSRASGWGRQADIEILAEADLQNIAGIASSEIPEVTPATDLAALMFTSGSTGTPRGVMITHRNIQCNTRDIISYMGLRAKDRVMVVLPFFYCFGLS